MSQNAIVIENLSKRYLIGHRFSSPRRQNYKALRDVIGREVGNFVRKAADFPRAPSGDSMVDISQMTWPHYGA